MDGYLIVLYKMIEYTSNQVYLGVAVDMRVAQVIFSVRSYRSSNWYSTTYLREYFNPFLIYC